MGIIPNSPKTGYGYIKVNSKEKDIPTEVLSFTEKPNLETAQKYLSAGNYLWNSGMFVFKYKTMMSEIKKYIPNHFEIISKIKNNISNETGVELANISRSDFNNFEKISIDFAVMEKSKLIKCIPVDFGWNDVGSFESLSEIFSVDENKNVYKDCKYIYLDSQNNIVISNKNDNLITTIGVSNMIIVVTDKSTLICKRGQDQKIKELLKKI